MSTSSCFAGPDLSTPSSCANSVRVIQKQRLSSAGRKKSIWEISRTVKVIHDSDKIRRIGSLQWFVCNYASFTWRVSCSALARFFSWRNLPRNRGSVTKNTRSWVNIIFSRNRRYQNWRLRDRENIGESMKSFKHLKAMWYITVFLFDR